MLNKIIGKNIEVTEALREAVDRKLSRLDKYFNEDKIAKVTLKVQKNNQTIEVTIPLDGRILRSEETTNDMYSSIDLVVDKIERQIRKQKTKLARNIHHDSLRFKEIVVDAKDIKEEGKLVKTKTFDVKPMNTEEAVLQMDLLGHNFFVFINSDNNEVNVVYKRKDGNYGLIDPTLV